LRLEKLIKAQPASPTIMLFHVRVCDELRIKLQLLDPELMILS